MPLQDLVSLGKADAASALLGGEVELKNLFLDFPWDAVSGIADFSNSNPLLAACADGKGSTFLHGLHAIDHDIEDGLFHEIAIDFHGQNLIGEIANHANSALLGVGSSQKHDIVQQLSKVRLFKLEVAWPGEVDENLHDAIESVDLAPDDVQVATGARVGLLQFVLQKMEVQNDGVDRIFDFMRYAAREAATRRHPPGHFDFILEPSHRFRIPHDQQGANLRGLVMDEVEGNLNAAAIRAFHFSLSEWTASLEAVENHGAERSIVREDIARAAAQHFAAWPSQEPFDGCADQHNVEVPREQHQAVLQVRHQLVDVVLQCGEDFLGVPHLASKVRDLERDQAEFVMFGVVLSNGVRASFVHNVQVAVDFFKGPESHIRNERCQEQRHENGYAGEHESVPQSRGQLLAQKDR